MRNVTIWEYVDPDNSMPPFVRVFTYKGYKGTLNEFLSPSYILRGSQIAPRQLDKPGQVTPFNPDIKGQTVLMGYGSREASEAGDGVPLIVTNTFEHAVNWLMKNGYEIYGNESATMRRRKTTVFSFYDEHRKYLDIAHQYEKDNVAKPVVVAPCVVAPVVDDKPKPVVVQVAKPPVPPTPPESRVLNDQGAPVDRVDRVEVKHTCKRSFMDNMMKFLRLFKN